MNYDFQLAEVGGPDDFTGMVAERKLDGTRAMIVDGDIVNRRGNHYTHKLPEIEIPDNMVLDGEVITHDFDFNSVLSRVHTENPGKIDRLQETCPAYFVVFDILEKDGEDLRDLSFRSRKEEIDVEHLDHVLEATTHEDPDELWTEAVQEGWEGIILKDPTSSYNGDRDDTWLKVKNWQEEVYEVQDWEVSTENDDGERDGFVVKVQPEGAEELQKVAVQPEGARDRIKSGNVSDVEVQYLETSQNGRLRKPSFKGIV